MTPATHRCGFVAIVGAPNVGKSTLLNRIVGSKVSIVSPKVQTTRTRVLGIAQYDAAQLVFIDTPGIFTPRRRLDRAMVAAAWTGAADADLTLMVVDAAHGLDQDSARIIARFKEDGRRAIVAVNKIDLVKKADLLALIARLDSYGIFTDTFLVSAQTGDGVADLLTHLASRVPEGPWHYPEDQLSDMNDRLLAAEITREKLYLQLHQELPYAATVETEDWEERADGSVAIRQVIYVEREGQKGIILGKGGSRIKQIGAASRLELEDILERRVHIFIFVKVRERWGDDPDRYRDWGLDYDA